MRVRKRRLIPVTVHQRFQLIDIGQAPGLIGRQRGIQFREAVQGGFPVHSIFQVFQATWPIPDQARQWVETPSATVTKRVDGHATPNRVAILAGSHTGPGFAVGGVTPVLASDRQLHRTPANRMAPHPV